MIKPMALGFIYIWMGQDMKAAEKMINNMDKVSKHGLMVLDIKEIILEDKNKVEVDLNGLMGVFMRVNLRITIYME